MTRRKQEGDDIQDIEEQKILLKRGEWEYQWIAVRDASPGYGTADSAAAIISQSVLAGSSVVFSSRMDKQLWTLFESRNGPRCSKWSV